MSSSTDFKKIYDLYQSEGVKKRISIVQFCKMNSIVYSHFERWYKRDRIASVVPVKIFDCDSLSVSQVCTIVPEALSSSDTNALIQSFDIRFSNGLEIHHGERDYRSFPSFLSKNRRTLKIVHYDKAADGHRQDDYGVPLFECPRY